MDWFQSLGAYSMLFNDTPALAADFTLRGPRGDFGYGGPVLGARLLGR
jgi:hypothetical protein